MGITEQLAGLAIDPPAGFLTPELIERVTERFLDTIGIMVAGASSPASQVLLKTVTEAGGAAEATIIGTSRKNSVVHAGFVNGASAHALEYDDLTPEITHLSSSMVPGCLAVAEKLDLSGRQLVEAFALGFEVAGRVGIGLKPLAMLDRGFHTPGILGGLGVAVAASRLMSLDARATRMAIGIMTSSAGGIRKNVGSPGKAFHIGNGVRAGLQSAVLAANGYEVDPDAIEGLSGVHGHERFGFAESYAGAGNYSLAKMVDDLGGEFALTRIPNMVRMHPCSTVTCVGIDAMIELATEHELSAADVERIDVACHPRLLSIAPYDEPIDSYRAKFCPAYTFAAALVDRQVGLAQFTEARVRDPQILELMRRIEVRARDDITEDHGWCNGEDNWCAVRIGIRLKDGRTLGGHYSQARGWPARPASWDDLRGKYEECTEGVLPRGHAAEAIGMIRDLVHLRSVRGLVRLLTRAE
jgi:2-methylcitrate dehydratase PrpD